MEKDAKPIKEGGEIEEVAPDPTDKVGGGGGGGGGGSGWSGWGFSPLSVFSDLQKAAAVAAEEISRNATAVAKSAAKSITEVEDMVKDSESLTGMEAADEESTMEANEGENEKLRKSALDKLEKVGENSFLGQRLKVLDSSVENFTSGAWQAIGSAWKGGSDLVHKLEHSAANLAESIQHGGLPSAANSVAPSLLETGKTFTAKGMDLLELVGKETMELLITETGIEVEKNEGEYVTAAEDQLYEEVTFDRCFYIYGGPEQLEELEALCNHYALLCNRRKAKLSSEQKSIYEGNLRQVQKILSLGTEIEGGGVDSKKGKKIETEDGGSDDEMKTLHDSSVRKAADMASGFTNVLSGLAAKDLLQRTAGRLESLHSEGVHRLSEMCCFAVSQLLVLGKSIISSTNKAQDEDADDQAVKIDWPDDSVEKAQIIRTRAESMALDTEAVAQCFITGICDVAEAFQAAIEGATAESVTSIQEKANAFREHLQSDQRTAAGKIQDGLQYLSFLVLSTSMPAV